AVIVYPTQQKISDSNNDFHHYQSRYSVLFSASVYYFPPVSCLSVKYNVTRTAINRKKPDTACILSGAKNLTNTMTATASKMPTRMNMSPTIKLYTALIGFIRIFLLLLYWHSIRCALSRFYFMLFYLLEPTYQSVRREQVENSQHGDKA